MTYASIVPQLPKSADGYVKLGLLTQTEVRVLAPMENKQRDALVGWVGGTIEAMVRTGQLGPSVSHNSSHMLNGLRGICARHHDLFVRVMPNLWVACAHTLLTTLVSLLNLTISLDIKESDLDVEPRSVLLLASFFAFFASFSITRVYSVAWAMVEELTSPFGADADDDYNPDGLLGSTERCLFANLRSNFDRPLIDAALLTGEEEPEEAL